MLAPRTPAEPTKAATAAPLRPAQPFFKSAPRRPAVPQRAPAPPAPGPALLDWLPAPLREAASDQAHRFRGFPLLTVLLGRDPFTGQGVARTPDTLVHGLLALTPDGEAQYAHLRQAGALPKAFNWLSTEADRRHLNWSAVRGMLATAWRSFSGTDLLLHPVDTLTRLAEPFRHLAAEAAGFAGAVGEQVLEFVFSSVLGPDAARVLAVLKRAGAAFRLILREPVRFAGYLARAATQGFAQFRAHAAQHLSQGLAGWLLGGPLAGLGLRLPARLDGPGLLSLGLQTLGLGYDYLRAKLVARVGPAAVARLEQGLGLLRTLLTQGPGAAAAQLAELAAGLPALVLGQLEAWVSRTVLTQALLKLGTLLVPGGAVVEAVRGVYNTVQFFLERGQQLGAVVSTFLDALGTIAAGGVAAAATRLEQTMGRLVPLVLAFLARLTGLGDISKPIQALLQQLRRPLETALEKLVGIILKLGQRLLSSPVQGEKRPATPAGAAPAVAEPVATPSSKKEALRQRFAVGPEQHTLYFEGPAGHPALMMASTPVSYEQFLANIAQELPRFSPQAKSSYRKAGRLAAQIDLAMAAAPTGPDATPAIAALLDQLAPHTAAIVLEQQKRSRGAGAGVYQVVLAGETSAGYGLGMTLTFAGPAIGQHSGTPPADAFRNTPAFAPLNARWQGRSGFYVQGHLLSEKLGGTGKDRRNLTPLFRKTNQAHESQIEKAVKARKEEALQGTSLISVYSVVPTYGRSLNQALIDQLHAAGDPQAALKEQVIRAEQHVPVALVCRLETWEPTAQGKLGKLVATKSKSEVIENDIRQDEHEYQVQKTKRRLRLHVALESELENSGFTTDEARLITGAAQKNGFKPFTDEAHLLSLIAAPGLFKRKLGALLANGMVTLK